MPSSRPLSSPVAKATAKGAVSAGKAAVRASVSVFRHQTGRSLRGISPFWYTVTSSPALAVSQVPLA